MRREDNACYQLIIRESIEREMWLCDKKREEEKKKMKPCLFLFQYFNLVLSMVLLTEY